jgi:glyceraldehyde 3-phosphate dehydrogenase
MTVRVAINGMGRVGRSYLRCLTERATDGIDVVAVNDVTDPETLAHLLRHDSTFGPWSSDVVVKDSTLFVDGRPIAVTAGRAPEELDWAAYGIDIAVEATGRFRTREAAGGHLSAGARKVLISAPGKKVDATIVMGLNEGSYDAATHDVISGASCTTNCAAPMVHVLHQAFTVQRGFLTTIHAYTNDQALLDSPHKDPRRARSAAVNLIPTSTGAAKAIGEVIPDLAGKLDGVAVRVPVDDGSLTDLALEVGHDVTAGEVNEAFRAAADGYLSGYLRYSVAPLVSRDIVGDPASCVFDSALTQANGRLVKVFGWYDNEWGYTNRLADLTEYVAARL